MDETQNQPSPLSFNSWLNVGFQGSQVTADDGSVLLRELDECLSVGGLIKRHLAARPARSRTWSRISLARPAIDAPLLLFLTNN